MKMKRGILLVVGILIMSLFNGVMADLNDAYSCLENGLGDNCGNTQSVQQAGFSLLAMNEKSGIRGECKSLLRDMERDDCWGDTKSSSCNLKSTAIAVLALNHAGVNVGEEADWLLAYRKRAPGLKWFLEIDANNATTCKINIGGSDKTFEIREDKKISGSSACLSVSEDGYFLEIRDTCYNKNFTISCDKDFVTTLFYKEVGYNVYHVSGAVHGAFAHGSTSESVNSYCFTAMSGSCDYEGSLWAALTLAKLGEDINPYLAYLSSNANENEQYLPYAFLYMLTGDDEYYVKLVEQQKEGKYWDERNKLFDTALALLALQGSQETADVQDYLFDIQDSNGCWSNIVNTAFLLFALDPSDAIPGGGIGSISRCEDFGKYCVASSECNAILDNFYCFGLGQICCDVHPLEQTCEEKGGTVCQEHQRCTSVEVTASDVQFCCLDSCVLSVNECEQAGYSCEFSCNDDQEHIEGYSCFSGKVCCKEKERGGWLVWIIILLILIALVVLGIIFKDKLRMWLFKLRSGVKVGKAPVGKRPGGRMPPPRAVPPMMPRRLGMPPRGMVRRPVRRSTKDKEFDDVMRKLKDMSK